MVVVRGSVVRTPPRGAEAVAGDTVARLARTAVARQRTRVRMCTSPGIDPTALIGGKNVALLANRADTARRGGPSRLEQPPHPAVRVVDPAVLDVEELF